jgi:hypothetical protein
VKAAFNRELMLVMTELLLKTAPVIKLILGAISLRDLWYTKINPTVVMVNIILRL